MRRITDTQVIELENLERVMQQKVDAVSVFVDSLNDKLKDLIESVQDENGSTLLDLCCDVDNAQFELTEKLKAITDAQNFYMTNRTDRWVRSESGEEYAEWKEEWETAEQASMQQSLIISVHGENVVNGDVLITSNFESEFEIPEQTDL